MNYPKFNTTEISIPDMSWEETFEVIENTSSSEAGTDIVAVVRYGKLMVSCSYKVTSVWVKIFETFRDMPYFTLTRYNQKTETYDERRVRMRGYRASKVRHSESLSVTQGIWKVSFKLIQF